jgi:LuxR family quorum-sensing system transcriptional regulator CciR
LIRITPHHRRFFELAVKHGLRDGVTVPCNIPGEWRGSCSFASRQELRRLDDILPLIQLAGAFAFQAARRISGFPPDPSASRTQVSRRQRECILLAARGKSDTDIGTILSLSPVTVRHYLDAARQRFDLATRQQLVIAALASGEISFTEL